MKSSICYLALQHPLLSIVYFYLDLKKIQHKTFLNYVSILNTLQISITLRILLTALVPGMTLGNNKTVKLMVNLLEKSQIKFQKSFAIQRTKHKSVTRKLTFNLKISRNSLAPGQRAIILSILSLLFWIKSTRSRFIFIILEGKRKLSSNEHKQQCFIL